MEIVRLIYLNLFGVSRPYYPQSNRYDVGRPGGGAGGGYERNDYRQNYQDYRGNGYDNRDPMYYNAMRGGNRGYGNRENSYESYYDGNWERKNSNAFDL